MNRYLDQEFGQLYVAEYFKPLAKEKMKNLVAHLKTTFEQCIKQSSWMSEPTKERAIQKLRLMNVHVGYPDTWRDARTLTIKKDTLVENIFRAKLFGLKQKLTKLTQPVDPKEWGTIPRTGDEMLPQVVNAYHIPRRKAIIFPAAILQPPFFDVEAPDVANYASIGFIIAHEITHGFDDQGRKYDEIGQLNPWWNNEEVLYFQQQAKIVVDQFNQYEPLPDLKVNGVQTLGENIADLSGLILSFQAYQNVLQAHPEQGIDESHSPEQLFFIYYAMVWRAKWTEDHLRRMLITDTHAPPDTRTNGPLSNFPAFHKAFDVKEGDAMYRTPQQRPCLWSDLRLTNEADQESELRSCVC